MTRSANLFVVGAPKAGTTTICEWLGHANEVFAPRIKEPGYYCSTARPFQGPGADVANRMIVTDDAAYAELYSAERGEPWLLDGSTDYLSDLEALRSIHRRVSSPRIVAVLRNPVYRAYSEHWHLVRDGLEKRTFREAMRLEDERVSNRWNTLFWHRRRGMYADSLRVLKEVFPPEQILVRLYDDLLADEEGFFRELSAFLGLSGDRREMGGADRRNRSGVTRSRFVWRLTRGQVTPGWLHDIFKKFVGRDRLLAFRSWMMDLNTGAPPPISEEVRRNLIDVFREDIEETSALLGRPLTSWLKQ